MSTISRRNVVKISLWTAPAIVVASAAPAFANSTKLECEPKGNRSRRLVNGVKSWDYHLKPGCDLEIEFVLIAGLEATQEQSNKRWTVSGLDWESENAQDVVIRSKDGRMWSGTVVFV